MTKFAKVVFFLTLFFVLSAVLLAQTKSSKKPAKPKKATPVAVKAIPEPTPTAPLETPSKRNERPAGETSTDAKLAHRNGSGAAPLSVPVYFYEFTRPGFTYARILIEHDEAGKGKISFQRSEFDELITDPIELSPATVAKISDALAALNFLDSTEDYQHSRDYSHMGNTQITIKKGGRERTAKYNWTENKSAKFLMDEYRRIGNEYIWRFEIILARQNQPLLTPGLMDTVDAYLRRGEISDPPHLVPFLTQLSTDERLPLMARNHAERLVKQIEKKKDAKE